MTEKILGCLPRVVTPLAAGAPLRLERTVSAWRSSKPVQRAHVSSDRRLWRTCRATGVDALELAMLSWVSWFNEVRLHSSFGHARRWRYEAEHYRHIASLQQPLPGEPSLY